MSSNNHNKKALGIMIGTLIFLLVLAVVLLSVIIVSIAKDDSKSPVTTMGDLHRTTTVSDSPILTFATDSSKKTDITTSKNPTTAGTTVATQPTITTTANLPQSTTVPTGTTATVTTTASSVVTDTTPPTVHPNVPVGKVETIKNNDGSITKRGAFRDNGPTGLHLLIEWEARYASEKATSVNLTVNVYLQSWSLGVAARNDGVLNLSGQPSHKISTNAIHIDKTKEVVYTPIASQTVTYTKTSADEIIEVDIDAAWHFKGKYSGVEIDWLTVSGTIEI